MNKLTKKRLGGLLRVFGLAVTILLVTAGVTIKRAEGHFAEVVRGFGEQVAQLHDFSAHSVPRKLFVNGLTLGLLSTSTEMPVADALERFQSLCHSVGSVDVPATLKQKLESLQTEGALGQAGVIREQTEHEGFVACLDLGEGLSGETLLKRLTEFGKTGDLQSLGQLHYALARRQSGVTTLLVFWTEGSTKLRELFPKTGDAPGRDLSELPRPTGGRRLLSAFEQGATNGLASYELGKVSIRSALAGYTSRLKSQGWQTVQTKNGVIVAEKAGRKVMVQGWEKGRGEAIISLLDLG
jgi:hypothetical protein